MPSFLKTLALNAFTIAIGSVGGLLGYLVGLPLGWLLGAMVFTVPLAMAGIPTAISPNLRALMIAVIGVMIGSSFTPELVAGASSWGGSLLGVAIYVTIIALIGVWFCRRIGRQERMTAAFSATPGGLSEMLIIAPTMGADVRTVSLVHGMRLVIVLFVVPAIVTSVALRAGGVTMDRSLDLALAMPLPDALLLVGCAIVGVPLARLLRFPASNLTGPLVLSAIVHLAQWTSSHPPQLVIVLAQIVIGASIARYFAGARMAQIVSGLAIGGGMTVITVSLAIAFALGFEHILDIPFATALLALVPGGLPEMSLVALSLGIDPAFVSVHHVFRVVLVLIVAPVLIPRWARAGAATKD
ncbi:AbrB family transcriptional regulator [Pelagibacterium montanilacus]|uniref:AbrB family transcriptional regulator n=1 Tax=Pelagibacterium montanilacus TaxID=2185280 RepID=UPI0013DEEECB|nr:AbrB family transcriptional regulator [Pelagibacterium montanilacus]